MLLDKYGYIQTICDDECDDEEYCGKLRAAALHHARNIRECVKAGDGRGDGERSLTKEKQNDI